MTSQAGHPAASFGCIFVPLPPSQLFEADVAFGETKPSRSGTNSPAHQKRSYLKSNISAGSSSKPECGIPSCTPRRWPHGCHTTPCTDQGRALPRLCFHTAFPELQRFPAVCGSRTDLLVLLKPKRNTPKARGDGVSS